MAFFKFRKGGDESAATPHPPESIEAMRRRARHRLIGAAVLVLVGVIGFPLLFDTQPRPIAVDIPIEIPDRNKVKPLAVPAQAAAPAASAAAPMAPPAAAVAVAPEEKPAAARAPAASGAIKIEAKPEPKVEPKVVAKAEPKAEIKPEPKPEAKPVPKPAAKPDDGAKARALLEGKPLDEPAPAAAEGRYVVQVGAFSDATKARETRLKVEKAGMKTYTHVAETKEGKRIRVRVGPFGTKAEADKAAEKIKGLELPAAILTL
ncbi:MAG: SPOR domain-containing protein [Burkholderiales bacterium]|nr:SPOR domain-containing protein [Burkholderiales bacterium]